MGLVMFKKGLKPRFGLRNKDVYGAMFVTNSNY